MAIFKTINSAFANLLKLLMNCVRVISGVNILVRLLFGQVLFRASIFIPKLAFDLDDVRSRNYFALALSFSMFIVCYVVLLLILAATFFLSKSVDCWWWFESLLIPSCQYNITFILTSIPTQDYKNLINLITEKLALLFRLAMDYLLLDMIAITFCTIFIDTVLGVFPDALVVVEYLVRLLSHFVFMEYTFESRVSILNIPETIIKKLLSPALIINLHQRLNVLLNMIGYVMKDFSVDYTSVDEYIRLIQKNDYAYFLHNLATNHGKINLDNSNITDAQVVVLMSSLEYNSHIASYIYAMRLNRNNITALRVPSELYSLQILDVGNNKLNNVDFPNGLNRIENIILQNNQLIEVNIPDAMLNRLTSLNLNNNPLTDATRYGLRKLRARLPRLRLGIDEQFEEQPQPDALNASMLQQHVDALVPYSITPPQHLNSVTAKTRVNLALVTLWLERKKREQKKNYEINLVNEVAKYLDGYPVTSDAASARVYGSLNMIERMISPVNEEDGTVFNNFLNQYEFDANGDIAKKTNNMFHQSVTRGVRDAVNIFSKSDSALSVNIRAASKKLFDA